MITVRCVRQIISFVFFIRDSRGCWCCYFWHGSDVASRLCCDKLHGLFWTARCTQDAKGAKGDDFCRIGTDDSAKTAALRAAWLAQIIHNAEQSIDIAEIGISDNFRCPFSDLGEVVEFVVLFPQCTTRNNNAVLFWTARYTQGAKDAKGNELWGTSICN